MIVGKVFKEIRLARGITLQHLADDYVSKSTISRFERDEADLTVEKLVHMLDKMKISMREFEFLTKRAHGTIPSLELLPKAVMESDPESLQKLASEEWNRFKETGSNYSKLSAIVLDAHYKSLDGREKEINERYINHLTDYLFQCELWTQFDLVLFGNSISYLPIETSIVLSKELIKKTEEFHSDRQSFETLINTLVNITLVCIEQDKMEAAEDFIVTLKNLAIDETFFLEKVIFKFAIGLFLIKNGEIEQGEEQANEALLAMKFADAPKMEIIFRTIYERIREQE
ncbi:Rgg/GadR/MutR family transcriptional regulator [Sporosarcina sp. BI001-red]|uniref:helix-turn-helix domain-containing protein n=1 Tax=Sporosarcina sp. BI001-red TaxID=2282866 RepID=UPI000E254674|nr:Rgg/GadR/MutR family transcriptional regulator [Sporosarcina sp. BI001-red]REB05483.1 Rgg/GadR/MutR family transcriptional regulator [Sporosarcina sp. BI001-red]